MNIFLPVKEGVGFLNLESLKKYAEIYTVKTKKLQAEIYPEQMLAMMNKFRTYSKDFNARLNGRNEVVEAYNETLKKSLKSEVLIELHAKENRWFKMAYNHLSTQLYNELAESQNLANGRMTVEKRPFKKLNNQYRETFHKIIWRYSLQLKKENQRRKKYHYITRPVERHLQPVEFTILGLREEDTHDNPKLDLCTRTVKAHIYRLREAGVLVGYSFHGQKCAVSYFVNNQIFTVFDIKTKKTLNAENKLITINMMQKLHHSLECTSSLNGKEVEKSIVENSTMPNKEHGKSHTAKFFPAESVQEHNESSKVKSTKAQNICAQSNELSEMIEDEMTLTYELHRHKHDNYNQGNNLTNFHKEAMYGNLTRAKFRVLLLQEFIKIFACQWKHQTVNNWDKVLHIFYGHFLLNRNKTIPAKPVLLYQFENLLIRKDYVFNYTQKHGFKPYPPSYYFNPFLDHKGTFKYTEIKLEQYLEKQNKTQKTREQCINTAIKNKRQQTSRDKIFKQIKRMEQFEISFAQLENYIQKNIPNYHHHLSQLPKYIQQYYLNQRTKAA